MFWTILWVIFLCVAGLGGIFLVVVGMAEPSLWSMLRVPGGVVIVAAAVYFLLPFFGSSDQSYHCGEGTIYTTYQYVSDGDTYTDFRCVAR